jgi:hypothetical protein
MGHVSCVMMVGFKITKTGHNIAMKFLHFQLVWTIDHFLYVMIIVSLKMTQSLDYHAKHAPMPQQISKIDPLYQTHAFHQLFYAIMDFIEILAQTPTKIQIALHAPPIFQTLF